MSEHSNYVFERLTARQVVAAGLCGQPAGQIRVSYAGHSLHATSAVTMQSQVWVCVGSLLGRSVYPMQVTPCTQELLWPCCHK